MTTSNKEFTKVDEYIETYPEVAVSKRMKEIRELIHDMVPEIEETISYGMPAFKLNGGYVMFFGAFKKHIGIYPFPSGVQQFEDAVVAAGYPTSSKGTIKLPHDMPLPWDILKDIIKFRVLECLNVPKKK
jgi:uncharacterized protein YdhG (YjbR/CyaY superfamily)